MRIAFICPFLFRYLRGIERLTVALANSIAKHDVNAKVDLITWRESSAWPWGKLEPNVYLHTLRLPRYFQALWAAPAYAWLLARLHPDIVNVFFTWHGEEIAFRLLLNSKPRLNLLIQYPAEEVPHRYRQIQQSRILRMANQIIAPSQYVADGIHDWLKRPAVIIPNGVDMNTFYPPQNKLLAKKKLDMPAESPVLATLAALEKRKHIHRILDALPLVVKQYPNLVYLVAGEGPERNNLTNQIKTLALEKHVRLLGALPDPLPVYHAADMLILLSKGEAFPLSTVEAMACGLPIIVPQRRPYDEHLSPNGTLWVDDNDANQIARAIMQLLSDPAKRIAMGQENKRHAENNFHWDVLAAKYLELFEKELEVIPKPG